MSDIPPGFPRSGDPGDEPDWRKLIEEMLGDNSHPAIADALRQLGVDKLDPAQLQMMATQMQAFFASAPTDGLDLDLSTDVARKTVAAAGDSIVTDSQRREITEAVNVAGLWLDAVTNLSPPGVGVRVWSRAEWVADTMPTWASVVAPVATGVTDAVTSALKGQLEHLGDGDLPGGLPAMPGLPPGFDPREMLDQFGPMMSKMSSAMFGAQAGQAIGNLAGEVLTGNEVGLPLVGHDAVAMLPANIAEFASGLEIDTGQVNLYLAVRESSRVRLFAGVPWLRPQLIDAVQAYARDISIDTDAIEAKVASIDPTDPNAMREALQDSLFTPTPSPAQQAALARLETLLALVEGWVDVVADRATAAHLPQSAALGEAVRRRRASGGPAEQLFGRLVGLQLRPRRLRDAANLFAALENAGNAELRDSAWDHPDVAPTAADLDDPLGYVERTLHGADASSDLDAALAEIFESAERAEQQRDVSGVEGPTDAGPWPNWPEPPQRRTPRPAEPGSETVTGADAADRPGEADRPEGADRPEAPGEDPESPTNRGD